MNKLLKSGFTLVAAGLMAASLSFAKSHVINVIYPSKVGSTVQLQPGPYQVRLQQTGTKSFLDFFNKNNEDVAQIPVKIKAEARKNPYTEVDYNTLAKSEHAITAIRLGGWSEEFVVPSPTKAMTSKNAGTVATKSSS